MRHIASNLNFHKHMKHIELDCDVICESFKKNSSSFHVLCPTTCIYSYSPSNKKKKLQQYCYQT